MAVATVEEVAAALHRELGVTAHEVRRQTRWRPTWFVKGERDGADVDVVVRGDRVDTMIFPLRHERAFHALLEQAGIPVAAVHGWLDGIGAVVLDHVPGRPDFHGVAAEERDVIVDEYLQAMAQVHALDIAPFVEAGIFRGTSPAESGTILHDHLETLWRGRKRRPDPFLEFCLGWLHRNPPNSLGRETPILWDTGQFHHAGGHLVSVLDLEFGHVGDPMQDLAVWRMRDTLIPFGEFPTLYARYEELTGTQVDLEAIKRHHVGATLSNQLIFGPAVADPVLETDLMNNMQWNSETNLHATEALAELLDVELPTIDIPEPRRTRQHATFAHLVGSLRRVTTDEELLRHDLRLCFRMARHLERVNEIGGALLEDDLDDLVPLLGWRPETWWDGDEALEKFVLADADAGDHDRKLVELFHRRNLRVHAQLGPEGSTMVAHHPTQRFDRA